MSSNYYYTTRQSLQFKNNFITLLTQLLLRVKCFNSCVSNSELDIGLSKYIYIGDIKIPRWLPIAMCDGLPSVFLLEHQ